MDIRDQIDNLASLMHTLMYADEVPNTFGMTLKVEEALRGIAASLRGEVSATTKERLDEVLTTVEENRMVFGIPEVYLIDAVYRQARNVRAILGHGPYHD